MSNVDAKIANAVQMLQGRLKKTDRIRRKWAKREGLTCFRVFDRDIPEIPLAIDRMAGHLVIAVYDSAFTHAWLIDALVDAASVALDVDPAHIHLKSRGTKASGQYEKLADSQTRMVVTERGLRFVVNLEDYLDTGLFLDHRETRARVRGEAEGKRVLNLFAYTGAFSVYAAAGGAQAVTTVDLSRNYLRWAEDNFLENDLGPDPRYAFVAADARVYLDDAAHNGNAFDIIVLDPPTFSVSKRMDGDFDIQRDHAELIAQCARILSPGGLLYFSNNLKSFELDATAFDGFDVDDITTKSVPVDFSHSHPHRCWRAVRMG